MKLPIDIQKTALGIAIENENIKIIELLLNQPKIKISSKEKVFL